jgi:hypothetical protein
MLTFILKTKKNATIICIRKENNMWKKLIIKLASKHITDAYLTGFEEGVEFQKSKNASAFKKGNIPKQHRAVGSERINAAGYIEVKVAEPRTWRKKHRIIYEEAYGKVLKGKRIIFADGNKLNLELDNLLLVTDNELLRMNNNNLIKENGDLTKSGLALTKLMNKMYEKKRRNR